MNKSLAQKAVTSALSGDWEKALEINKKILRESPKDIDSLNRLARAYAELGNLPSAKKTASKVIKVDPFNAIATRSLEKWKGFSVAEKKQATPPLSAGAFLEEPGKTKTASLLHIGDDKTIAKLHSGDEVKLNPRQHRVSITTQNGKYLGRLSDDLSARIRKLSQIGNKYRVFVKSVTPPGTVKVFIRETKRSPKLGDVASFSTEKIDYSRIF